MAFYLIGSYINSIDDSTMQQLNAMSDPAANIYQESLIKGFFNCGIELIPYSFKVVSKKLYSQYSLFYKSWCSLYPNVSIKPRSYIKNFIECYFFLYKSLRSKLQRNDVIILYSLNIAAIISTLVACRKYHNKICVIITDLPLHMSTNGSIFYHIMKWVANKIIKSCMRKITCFGILSEYMSEYLPKHANYVVIEGIYSPCNLVNIPQPKIDGRILYSGTLAERYGIKNLLLAFNLLKNENYSLIICGRGDSEEYVKNMATKDRRIQYLGSIPHDEIIQLQRTASLLVNPRTPEGIYTKYSFPSKTMEYLASGTPTLLYELPGNPKEYYHYCYSLNDQSITALAEKVDEVLSLSIEERTKLGEKAQQFILDTKNATIQCTKILELIKRT